MVSQVGFEPTTRCLEGSRSIQLSYWDICVTHKFYDKRFAKTSHRAQILSEAEAGSAHSNIVILTKCVNINFVLMPTPDCEH